MLECRRVCRSMAPSKLPLIMWDLYHHLIRGSIPNGISIGSAAFALLMAEFPYILQWAPLSPKLSLPMGYLDPHLTHDSIGPFKPTTQTASRSLRPFLNSPSQSYFTTGLLPPQNCPFPWGMWTPSKIWFLGPTLVLNSNGISMGSSVFAGLTTVSVVRWCADGDFLRNFCVLYFQRAACSTFHSILNLH